jgi:hypothetical protein
MFCNAGFIQSKDDMEVFKGIIDGITASVKDQAIKEYEAQKAIDAEKAKAVIETGNQGTQIQNDLPSAETVSQNYEKYIKKYQNEGLSFKEAMAKVDEIIMKG